MTIREFLNEWGIVVGVLIVLLYGAFGSYCSIRKADGPKERASRVKAAIRTWIFLAAVLGLIFGLQFVLPGFWSSVAMNFQGFLTEWGGYLGGLIGVLALNFGTYWSSRNTVGPKERAYMWKVNVVTVPIVTVALLGLAVVLEHVLPPPYNRSSLLLVVFLILLPYLGISTVVCNRRLAKIRAEDSQE